MSKKSKFKKGDTIVHFGRINDIFKVKKRKTEKEEETIVYFRPHYKTKKDKSVVYSIPIGNIDKTGIRKPISKKRLRKFYKKLTIPAKPSNMMNISRAKRMIESGEIKDIITVIRRLWKEKYNPETNYTKSRQRVFKNAVNSLIEEFAFVDGISRRSARKKIFKKLKKQEMEKKFPPPEAKS